MIVTSNILVTTVDLNFVARCFGINKYKYTCMDNLPEVVRVALQNACNSGRTLSWKVQENAKGTLIQLIWKLIPVVCLDKGHSISMVGSNSNSTKPEFDKPADKPRKRRRNNPSRIRRNARRLRSFLDSRFSSGSRSKPEVPKLTDSTTLDEGTIEDKGLKQFLEENVGCVSDFVIREGEPSLHLELNNGDHMWTPVHVRQFKRLMDVPAKPVSQDIPASQLLDMDSIEYCGGESGNAPGVVLRKGSLEVWTPIAVRLHTRIRDKTNCTFTFCCTYCGVLFQINNNNNKLVISRALGMHGMAWHLLPSCFGAIHPSRL